MAPLCSVNVDGSNHVGKAVLRVVSETFEQEAEEALKQVTFHFSTLSSSRVLLQAEEKESQRQASA
jgi:hypothetical protein